MSNIKKRRLILIDLDGVLNEYNGCFDEKYIPKINKGARQFLKKLSENYIIKIFTVRNKILVSKWVIENNIQEFICDVTNVKEVCELYIDDRCIGFKGNYQKLLKQIYNFKPWYK